MIGRREALPLLLDTPVSLRPFPSNYAKFGPDTAELDVQYEMNGNLIGQNNEVQDNMASSYFSPSPVCYGNMCNLATANYSPLKPSVTPGSKLGMYRNPNYMCPSAQILTHFEEKCRNSEMTGMSFGEETVTSLSEENNYSSVFNDSNLTSLSESLSRFTSDIRPASSEGKSLGRESSLLISTLEKELLSLSLLKNHLERGNGQQNQQDESADDSARESDVFGTRSLTSKDEVLRNYNSGERYSTLSADRRSIASRSSVKNSKTMSAIRKTDTTENALFETNEMSGKGASSKSLLNKPLILAHPDEFKNASSFLKVYGDPLCGQTNLRSSNSKENGNWRCHKCANVNYPRRFRCNKCYEIRDEEGDLIVANYVLTVYQYYVSEHRKNVKSMETGDSNKKRKAGKKESFITSNPVAVSINRAKSDTKFRMS